MQFRRFHEYKEYTSISTHGGLATALLLLTRQTGETIIFHTKQSSLQENTAGNTWEKKLGKKGRRKGEIIRKP